MQKFISIMVVICVLILLSALAVLPLQVYVIRDIATLFKIDFITALSKEVIFGVLLVVSLVKITIDKKEIFSTKEEKEAIDILKDGFKSIGVMFIHIFLLLLILGMAYFVHLIQF